MKPLALLCMLSLTGCTAHKHTATLPSLVIPPTCATYIEVMNCDLNKKPLHCQGPVKLSYKDSTGCAEVKVKEVTK